MARSKKPDWAQKIADKYLPKAGGYIGEAIDHLHDDCARDIRRLVAREVKREREKCQRLTNVLAGEYLEVYETFPSSMPETLTVAKRLDNLIHQMEKGTP